MEATNTFLNPSPALLCKLASIAVHADEMMSGNSHEFDRIALQSAISDPEVVCWLTDMTKNGLAPVKRSTPPRRSHGEDRFGNSIESQYDR